MQKCKANAKEGNQDATPAVWTKKSKKYSFYFCSTIILLNNDSLLLKDELINMARAWDKEISESLTGVEPMTSRIHGERSIHWATRTHGEQGHLTRLSTVEFIVYSDKWIKMVNSLLVEKQCFVSNKILRN